MNIYYTEYPQGQFKAKSDSKALELSKAKVIYRESNTPDGRPFFVIRDWIADQMVIEDSLGYLIMARYMDNPHNLP